MACITLATLIRVIRDFQKLIREHFQKGMFSTLIREFLDLLKLLSPGQTIQHFTQHFAQHFFSMLVVKRSNISPNIFMRRSKKEWVEIRTESCSVSRHFDPKKRKTITSFPFYFLCRNFHSHRGLSGRASLPPIASPKLIPLRFLVAPLCYSFFIDA